MKKLNYFYFIALLFFVYMLFGCESNTNSSQETANKTLNSTNDKGNNSDLLVGRWKTKLVNSNQETMEGIYEYKNNGEYIIDGTFIFDGNTTKCSIKGKGIYNLTNNYLSSKITKVDILCKPPRNVKAIEESYKEETSSSEIIQLDKKTLILKEGETRTTYFKID